MRKPMKGSHTHPHDRLNAVRLMISYLDKASRFARLAGVPQTFARIHKARTSAAGAYRHASRRSVEWNAAVRALGEK